jgi:hypothetical protein
MTTDAKTEATGTIEVSVWAPEPYDAPGDGTQLVKIHVEEAFDGDVVGTGVATFLQALRADGSASFCGLERVTGAIHGRAGSFVLQDEGELDVTGRVAGRWQVVAGSGTGELAGLRGTGTFAAEVGQRSVITLDHWFE